MSIEIKDGKKIATLKLPNGNTVRLTKPLDKDEQPSKEITDLREHREKLAQQMVDQTAAELEKVVAEVRSLRDVIDRAHVQTKPAYTFKINRDKNGFLTTIDATREDQND